MGNNSLVTEEEMAVLLEQPAANERSDARRRAVPYNFRRPDRLSKEQVRSLYLLHDMFSHGLSSSLPIFLRTITEVSLISVEQRSYSEYIHGLPDPTTVFTLSLSPLQGVCSVELSPSLAFPLVDRLLGGPGHALAESRAVTEIEQQVLEGFLKLLADDLREAWKPIVELDLQIVERETRPQLLQIVAPNEVVLAIVFHLQIGEAKGMLSLCVPAITLEPVLHKFNKLPHAARRETKPEQQRALLDKLAATRFPITAEIYGARTAMNDLLDLAPGDVLLLDHRLDQPVTITIGGVKKFAGHLAALEGRTVVRISESTELSTRD